VSRYVKPRPRSAGWTDRLPLEPNGLVRIACCDCGLVHDLYIEVFRKHRPRPRKLPWRQIVGTFRAKRDNRATAALRRHRFPHLAAAR
jgi:hypothetical protein